jgi:hypothetical protein
LTPDDGVYLRRSAVAEFELQPSPASDVELLEVRAILYSDGGLSLIGTTLVYDNDTVAFHVEADVRRGIYTTTYFTEEEIDEVKQSQSYIEASREYRPQNLMQAQANTYTAFLQLLSEDGVGIDLAKTTGGADWTDDGANVTTLSASIDFWAATTPLSNWFISSASSGTSIPYNVPASTNSLFAEGHYYNYDFWDNDKITTIDHAVNLDIYPKLPSGQVGTITWGFDEGGENSWFIVHDIYWTVF